MITFIVILGDVLCRSLERELVNLQASTTSGPHSYLGVLWGHYAEK